MVRRPIALAAALCATALLPAAAAAATPEAGTFSVEPSQPGVPGARLAIGVSGWYVARMGSCSTGRVRFTARWEGSPAGA